MAFFSLFFFEKFFKVHPSSVLPTTEKKKRKKKKSSKRMEVEEEHPLLQRMRRAAEKLCNHHHHRGDDSDDDAEKLASTLRNAREIFTAVSTIQTTQTTEVNAKDCVRVRWSLSFFFFGGFDFFRTRTRVCFRVLSSRAGTDAVLRSDLSVFVQVYLQHAQSFQSLLEIWDAHHLNNAQKVGVPLLLLIATLLRVKEEECDDDDNAIEEEEEKEEEEKEEEEATKNKDKDRRKSATGASTRTTATTSTSVSRLALDGLARNIISRRMRQMYSHIASGVRIRIIAAFDVLTAIVQRDYDGSLAGETFRQFDWTLQVLQKVATPRIDNNNSRKKKKNNKTDDNNDEDDYDENNDGRKSNNKKNAHLSLFREERAKINQAAKASRKNIEKASNRFAFAQFYLAFLESNDESVVRSAATNRNVMYLFVRSVSKDDSETQCRFLSVLWKSVLNINVSAIKTPLKIKLATFTDVLLEQLATMAALNDCVENVELNENKKRKSLFLDTTVTKMAVDILREVCVNPRHGISPSQVSAGDTISRLLMKLRPAECDAHLSVLSEACSAHPRLAAQYVTHFSSDLQPKNTEKWLSTIRMLGDLIQTSAEYGETTAGDFSDGITNYDGNDDDVDDEKIELNARRWATSALPSSLTKSIFVKSLGHKSIVVRQAALQFLAKCLRATKKRLDLAERSAIANQIKQRKKFSNSNKNTYKGVYQGYALARKREILRRARGIASADVFPDISVLIQIVMKGGMHVPEQLNEKMDTDEKDRDGESDNEDNEDEVSEFSQFSKLLALEALAERVALSPLDTVNFVDVAKILPNSPQGLFHNTRESIAAISVARNTCTASSTPSKNTLVAVFKCYAFAVTKDIPEIKSDESDDSRLLSENLKMLFKQSIIESNTLEESSRTDRSTKCAFEREAETYAHGFAKCCRASTSLDLTSTLADFLADAIVSASKRTNFDVVMEEEMMRPSRFNPVEREGNITSVLSPLSVVVFENALKVLKSVKKSKEEIGVVREFAASLVLPSLLRTTDFWTHAVALSKIGVHNFATSKYEKKVMKTIDDVLCKERQIFLSDPKNTKGFTIENIEEDAVEIVGALDAQYEANMYSLFLQNYVHEAKVFTKLFEEVLRKINEMSRSSRGALLSAVSFSVAKELSRTKKDCFDVESQSKIASALAKAIEDTELKFGIVQSAPRKRLVDAFLMHSENESLVVFAKFASEDAQIDAILKYRSSKNFVLMASMSDISLSSRSVSFDGKSKVIALLLDVILEDTDGFQNTIPILWVLARVFERNSSEHETNIAAPYSSGALRALEKILKGDRHEKREVVLAEAAFVSALVNSNAGEICAATFLLHCNFKEDGAVFEKGASGAMRKCAEYAAIRDIVNVNISDGTQFLSNIASLVIKQMNPTTHGNMVCSARALQIELNGDIEKQRKSFEEKLSNAFTNAYLNETFEKECVENITMAFKVCFDVNCPREYRIRCVGFILRKLTLLAGSASNTGKTVEKLLANKIKEELSLVEKRCSTDDVTHTNAFTFALKENFIISNEDDVIELVNAARMFVFSSFTNKFKNTRRLDACAKIIAALTPKSAKAMNKRYKLRETFEAFATSCFDCVCQNEKFEYVFVSREELEENETTSGLLDSLPQNPSSMHFVREYVDERSEELSSLSSFSLQNQTQPVELKRAFAKVLHASLELKHRVYNDTQQTEPDAWATEKAVNVLPLLLKGYNASSSALDSLIMRTIVTLDALSGQDVLKKSGFVFGSAAEKFFESDAWIRLIFNDHDDKNDKNNTDIKMLLKERVGNAIGTSLLDCKRSAMTATAFPQRRKLFFWEDDEREELVLTTGNKIFNCLSYDPSWILPLTLRNLETESLSPREYARSGILSIVISALSSTDINFRRLARAILFTMDKIVTRIVTGKTEDGKEMDLTDVMLARASFRERTQVLSILRWIRNSNDIWNNDVFTRDDKEKMDMQKKCQHAEDVIWPTTAAVFAAEAMWLACRPESEFFVVANKQVLKRMSIDLDRLPMFLPLINAGDVDAKAKRTWALRQLNSSFHSLSDKDNLSSRVFRKQFVFEILSSQTCSHALADSNTRLRTMRLIKNVCENGSDSFLFEIVEHVSFIAFLTRRIEESVDPRLSISSSQDLSVEHRSHAAVLSVKILKDLAEGPDAFVFAARDFVDAVRRVRSTILPQLESSGSCATTDYLVARNCFKAYIELHAVVSKRLEKRRKLNSQLATLTEMCRLLVAMNNTHNTNNNNNNNNNDYDDSSSVVKNTFAEILEISSFDFSCLSGSDDDTEEKENEAEMETVEAAARSIASSVSRLAGWLNEHFSTNDEPKFASRFLCRTLLNAPDVLLDVLFTSSDVQTFAKIIASDCDHRRKSEVNAALVLLLDFLLDENAAEAAKIKNSIEDLMLSNTQNEGNEVLMEAKLREVFFFSSSSSSIFMKKENKETTTVPTKPCSTPIPKTKTRKRKQTPGGGAKSRRAEKRAAKNRAGNE